MGNPIDPKDEPKTAELDVLPPGRHERQLKPRAPSWWRRALRRVLPGTALPQLLYDELQTVDPKTLRTIMSETTKEKTFDGALWTALRTAFAIMPETEGALPPAGSTLPEGLDADTRITVPLRDIMAFNNQIRALKAENEELRAQLRDAQRRGEVPHETAADFGMSPEGDEDK